MNRYLIVVFSVLTACASAVPNVDYEDLVDDVQRFAAWYADHSDNFEDCYVPILVPAQNKSELSEIYTAKSLPLPLIKKLPKFPYLNTDAVLLYEPPCNEIVEAIPAFNFQYKTVFLTGSNSIRAPGLS
ncbi:hypothetical protein [Ancylomarina sp. 16SWW S1-10-2]|uniref:hypothetical protein n=1 Tax=Ancylomarina sp. 16SWW S1-10-2 TaxID=2499681 RepID=UPI0012AEA42E|nr:hypothetical protein [Ancylomarina sp. 16SWW S1-10-2]MRT93606.1 hypothetical protein [Ancylomarina sp. 16SWW S1-10-2]